MSVIKPSARFSNLNTDFEGTPSTTFSIDGPELDRNRVQLGLGLTTDIGKVTTLRIGLLFERWFFFAQANHPQNLYYQTV